jgi:two-component system chemotaxis response regulator CheB
VLLVEDSMTARKRFGEVLGGDREFDVVGEAEDGKKAIELCQELHPDVITMDMMLPVMSGLAATEYIMAYCPTPILIVSSSTNRGELFKTYEALAAGAVDVLEKPGGNESNGSWERKFISALKLVSRIRVITHPRGRLGTLGQPQGQRQQTPLPPLSREPMYIDRYGRFHRGPQRHRRGLARFARYTPGSIAAGSPYQRTFRRCIRRLARWADGLAGQIRTRL